MCFVGALLCESSNNMRVIGSIMEDIEVGMSFWSFIDKCVIYLFHFANPPADVISV